MPATRTASKQAKIQPLDRDTIATLPPYRQKLFQLQKELNEKFLERGELIRLLLTAYIARTNAFVGGPPGTGKTDLGRTLANAFQMKSFYYLMGADTTPDELLGPPDLAALTRNEWLRELVGGIGDSHQVILDEAFKANSPCLNKLLGLILDHTVTNGKQTIAAPLISMFAFSNELPQDDSLAPFWDRLTLRFWVEDVNPGHRKLLMLRAAGIKKMPTVGVTFTLAELERMQQEAASLPVPESVIDLIQLISKNLADGGIKVSTRKYVQVIGLLRAYAYVQGASAVDEEHLTLLEHIFWSEHAQRAQIAQEISNALTSAFQVLEGILDSAQETIRRVQANEARDSLFYKGVLVSAEDKIRQMVEEVDEILASATPGGKKAQKALAVRDKIEDSRKAFILGPLNRLEFGR